MTIGTEIPFRRSKREHDTGSLVFDQERKHTREEHAGSAGERSAGVNKASDTALDATRKPTPG